MNNRPVTMDRTKAKVPYETLEERRTVSENLSVGSDQLIPRDTERHSVIDTSIEEDRGSYSWAEVKAWNNKSGDPQ